MTEVSKLIERDRIQCILERIILSDDLFHFNRKEKRKVNNTCKV